MGERSHYVILGVSEDESQSGIRAAYRALARRHHPDVAGDREKQTFQAIAEAYRVLSDPGTRRQYDERLRLRAHGAARPAASAGRADFSRPFGWDLVPLDDVSESVRPSFDALSDRFLRSFTGRRVPKAERLESLDFDLVLTRDEATCGGTVRVPAPAFVPCPGCAGSGLDWLFLPCAMCARHGVVESERRVAVTIPPLTRSGTIVEVPLEALGIHNLCLRLHVSVT